MTTRLRWRLAAAFATAFVMLALGRLPAQSAITLTVRVDRPGARIDPMFYGLMTEEINFSYDGGLYAELIRNRALRDDEQTPVHWSVAKYNGGDGAIALEKDAVPGTALTTALRLDATKLTSGQRAGVANEGYWGIPIKPNTTYHASFYARASRDVKAPLRLSIESADGATVVATANVSPISSQWKEVLRGAQDGRHSSVRGWSIRHLDGDAGNVFVQLRLAVSADLWQPSERQPRGHHGAAGRDEARASCAFPAGTTSKGPTTRTASTGRRRSVRSNSGRRT